MDATDDLLKDLNEVFEREKSPLFQDEEENECNPADSLEDDFLWDFNPHTRQLLSTETVLCDRCGELKECLSNLIPFGDKICRNCRWRFREDFEQIPQNRVAYDYGISVNELKEACLPSKAHLHGKLAVETRPNKNERLADIKLYYRFQLKRLCESKYGSVAEWQNKRDERRRQKYKVLLQKARPPLLATPAKRITPFATGCEHQ